MYLDLKKRCEDTAISVYDYHLFSNHRLLLFPHLSSLHILLRVNQTSLLSKRQTLQFFVSGKGPEKSKDTICPGPLGSSRETNGHRLVLRPLFLA